jgi:hypothetical protein
MKPNKDNLGAIAQLLQVGQNIRSIDWDSIIDPKVEDQMDQLMANLYTKEVKRRLIMISDPQPMHPSLRKLVNSFVNPNLPPHLRGISEKYKELVDYLVENCPHNADLTVGIRKLWESKNAAIFALVEDELAD